MRDRKSFVTNIMADIAGEWMDAGRTREAMGVFTMINMLVDAGRLEINPSRMAELRAKLSQIAS